MSMAHPTTNKMVLPEDVANSALEMLDAYHDKDMWHLDGDRHDYKEYDQGR